MRISDWSSDVCSSDLSRCAAVRRRSCDAAAVHRKGRCLDGSTAASDDLPGFGPFEIPIANFVDRMASLLLGLLDWVSPLRNLAEKHARGATSLFGRHQTITSDDLATGFAKRCSILDAAAFRAFQTYADHKTAKLILPYHLIQNI